ncbi:EamA family transporter [Rhodococcus gannanensis]|jgi:O-acetylserine/cysteine efflux transporter|uniref:EamA family transporter n=1 Tax=Rhodococcus gannanensis TaxID=1960308 RepID=A0ABW4P0D7_9NOCA
MTNRDRLLGITVALLWGLNFLAIRAGLDQFPPFFFVALRFLVIAVPVVLFVPRPNVPLRWLLLYGTGFGVLQFLFLFWAMNTGMPTGLASLVLQASAPMTVLLGALLLGERVSRRQMTGIVVAVGGMAVIGWDRFAHASLLPLLLTLCGAFGWALGNIGSRQARPDSPMRLMLWMTVIPPLPMLAVSAVVEGPTAGWSALGSAFDADGVPALVGLVYIALLGTIVGSGLWTGLMSRYPASTVAPFSLLVPVVGIVASWLVLGEQPTVAALCGGVVVVGGCLYGMTRPRVGAGEPTVSLPTPAPARV